MRTSKVLILSVEEARNILARHFVEKISDRINKDGIEETAKAIVSPDHPENLDVDRLNRLRRINCESIGMMLEKVMTPANEARHDGKAVLDFDVSINLDLDDVDLAVVEDGKEMYSFWVRKVEKEEKEDMFVCVCGEVDGVKAEVYKDEDGDFYVRCEKGDKTFWLYNGRWDDTNYYAWPTLAEAKEGFNATTFSKRCGTYQGESVVIRGMSEDFEKIRFCVVTTINGEPHSLNMKVNGWDKNEYTTWPTVSEAEAAYVNWCRPEIKVLGKFPLQRDFEVCLLTEQNGCLMLLRRGKETPLYLHPDSRWSTDKPKAASQQNVIEWFDQHLKSIGIQITMGIHPQYHTEAIIYAASAGGFGVARRPMLQEGWRGQWHYLHPDMTWSTTPATHQTYFEAEAFYHKSIMRQDGTTSSDGAKHA